MGNHLNIDEEKMLRNVSIWIQIGMRLHNRKGAGIITAMVVESGNIPCENVYTLLENNLQDDVLRIPESCLGIFWC